MTSTEHKHSPNHEIEYLAEVNVINTYKPLTTGSQGPDVTELLTVDRPAVARCECKCRSSAFYYVQMSGTLGTRHNATSRNSS